MKKQIISFLSVLTGFFAWIIFLKKIEKKEKEKIQILSDKHLALFLMMNQWVQVKQKEKHLADYLEQSGYKNIAIYGMSYVGKSLLNELKNTKITVKYGIDQRADELCFEIPMYFPDDNLEDIDAIIVTSISFIDEIKEKLMLKVLCPIISLEDILYDI